MSVDVIASGLRFGEGPRWHHGKLWFSDMYDHQVKAVDLTGRLVDASFVTVEERDGHAAAQATLPRRVLRVRRPRGRLHHGSAGERRGRRQPRRSGDARMVHDVGRGTVQVSGARLGWGRAADPGVGG